MSRKYYKITKLNNHSVCNISLAVQYKIGEFVKADYGMPLYVFDSLKRARNFAAAQWGYWIYECEIKGRCRIISLVRSWTLPNLQHIYKTKKSITKFLDIPGTRIKIPKGTVAVKQVKLLKRLVNE